MGAAPEPTFVPTPAVGPAGPAVARLALKRTPASGLAALKEKQSEKVTAQQKRDEELAAGVVVGKARDATSVESADFELGVPGGLSNTVVQAVMPTADLARLVRGVALRQSVDPALIMAMVAIESAFRPEAVSPRGARGLLQLMPATASSLGVSDPHDPIQNLVGAVTYIGRLLTRYNGDTDLALAAYNAGEASVAKHHGIPPFAETQTYVQRVQAVRRRMAP
jgi:soluble lytic murein transglycosylase-like protein